MLHRLDPIDQSRPPVYLQRCPILRDMQNLHCGLYASIPYPSTNAPPSPCTLDWIHWTSTILPVSTGTIRNSIDPHRPPITQPLRVACQVERGKTFSKPPPKHQSREPMAQWNRPDAGHGFGIRRDVSRVASRFYLGFFYPFFLPVFSLFVLIYITCTRLCKKKKWDMCGNKSALGRGRVSVGWADKKLAYSR